MYDLTTLRTYSTVAASCLDVSTEGLDTALPIGSGLLQRCGAAGRRHLKLLAEGTTLLARLGATKDKRGSTTLVLESAVISITDANAFLAKNLFDLGHGETLRQVTRPTTLEE